MTDVLWSRWRGADCIRLGGLAPEADVQVRPRMAGVTSGLPPMGGRLVRDGADLCFVPRFAFADGTAYTVFVEGVPAKVLVRPRPDLPVTTEVLDIRPTAAEVPRNLLRCYVSFSAPMSEGYAAQHVRLVDDAGEVMAGALLPTQHELWDGGRRRLTVLLDPGRIKRGLAGHQQAGYPLRPGESFRIVIDDGFRDARGIALRAGAERRYEVGGDERRRVEPDRWTLSVPPSRTCDPLDVAFGRPLDHGLLARCLRVIGPDGRPVGGTAEAGPGERSWRLTPGEPWALGAHQLVVDPVLEDLAGNSVSRVFDRDLGRPEDEPRQARPVTLPFRLVESFRPVVQVAVREPGPR
jgi:hypothetical protein